MKLLQYLQVALTFLDPKRNIIPIKEIINEFTIRCPFGIFVTITKNAIAKNIPPTCKFEFKNVDII
jgi:hypothetical protein